MPKLELLDTDDYFLLTYDGKEVDSGHSMSSLTVDRLLDALGIQLDRTYIEDEDTFLTEYARRERLAR